MELKQILSILWGIIFLIGKFLITIGACVVGAIYGIIVGIVGGYALINGISRKDKNSNSSDNYLDKI